MQKNITEFCQFHPKHPQTRTKFQGKTLIGWEEQLMLVMNAMALTVG